MNDRIDGSSDVNWNEISNPFRRFIIVLISFLPLASSLLIYHYFINQTQRTPASKTEIDRLIRPEIFVTESNHLQLEDWETGETSWNVVIFEIEKLRVTFLCGGVLVKPGIVLTSASCISEKSLTEIRVINGKSRIYTVQDGIIHSDFNHGFYYHDIILLKLWKPTEGNSAVQLLPPLDWLSITNASENGRTWITHWDSSARVAEIDATTDDEDSAEVSYDVDSIYDKLKLITPYPLLVLHDLNFKHKLKPSLKPFEVLPLTECEHVYRDYFSLGKNKSISFDAVFPNGLNSSFICASNPTYKDVDCKKCRGDQLLVTNVPLLKSQVHNHPNFFNETTFTLIGTRVNIFIKDHSFLESNQKAVLYTNVTSYLKWIKYGINHLELE